MFIAQPELDKGARRFLKFRVNRRESQTGKYETVEVKKTLPRIQLQRGIEFIPCTQISVAKSDGKLTSVDLAQQKIARLPPYASRHTNEYKDFIEQSLLGA